MGNPQESLTGGLPDKTGDVSLTGSQPPVAIQKLPNVVCFSGSTLYVMSLSQFLHEPDLKNPIPMHQYSNQINFDPKVANTQIRIYTSGPSSVIDENQGTMFFMHSSLITRHSSRLEHEVSVQLFRHRQEHGMPWMVKNVDAHTFARVVEWCYTGTYTPGKIIGGPQWVTGHLAKAKTATSTGEPTQIGEKDSRVEKPYPESTPKPIPSTHPTRHHEIIDKSSAKRPAPESEMAISHKIQKLTKTPDSEKGTSVTTPSSNQDPDKKKKEADDKKKADDKREADDKETDDKKETWAKKEYEKIKAHIIKRDDPKYYNQVFKSHIEVHIFALAYGIRPLRELALANLKRVLVFIMAELSPIDLELLRMIREADERAEKAGIKQKMSEKLRHLLFDWVPTPKIGTSGGG